MAHPGWLSNKVLQVEIPGHGAFQVRVLGVKRDILVVSAPVAGNELKWIAKDARLLLRVATAESGPGGEPVVEERQAIEATVVDRKLKPMPILFLKLAENYPFVAAATERRNRLVVVTSGKGGTGKTFVSVNLACAWSLAGLSVAVVDGDIGTANVATALGLRPATGLADVIAGRISLKDTATPARGGLTVFPGTIGDAVGADLSPWQFARIISGLGEVETGFDQVIVDTGAGIARNVTGLLYVADFILLVVNDTPTSIIDAYALIKQISSQFWIPEVGLVVNRVTGELDETVVQRFLHTAKEYLSVPVVFLGHINDDPEVMRSLKAAAPVVTFAPHSAASRDIQALATTLASRLTHTAQARHLRSRTND